MDRDSSCRRFQLTRSFASCLAKVAPTVTKPCPAPRPQPPCRHNTCEPTRARVRPTAARETENRFRIEGGRRHAFSGRSVAPTPCLIVEAAMSRAIHGGESEELGVVSAVIRRAFPRQAIRTCLKSWILSRPCSAAVPTVGATSAAGASLRTRSHPRPPPRFSHTARTFVRRHRAPALGPADPR